MHLESDKEESLNFIEKIIEKDNADGLYSGKVHTRFPPEPNGYLHIGHAKAIFINFETAKKYGGVTNLRFDDTNPTTEKTDYVEAIKKDIHWLGYDWEDRLFFASDNFNALYEYAIILIKKGKAYVDFSSAQTMDEEKRAGKDSSFRNSSIEENLMHFQKMKGGDYPDGHCVLRLKIVMNHPNRLMRDPVIYRIKRAHHHRTGDSWCIYPMYDWAHGQSDSIEGITHSLCSLEFEHHRPLYDWCQEQIDIPRSKQIEFSRLNLDYTVTSKRKLLELIENDIVIGWDDPRMPTISGMRRRGYTPEGIKNFIQKAGVSKRDQFISLSLLEACIREDLNKKSQRVMVVMDPIKLSLTNVPDNLTHVQVENNPEDPEGGKRDVPFSGTLFIDRQDFAIEANRKWRRLAPDRNVRLKGAFIVHCDDYVCDEAGNVTEVIASIYPDSMSGQDTSGIKAKGTIQWVDANDHTPIMINNYDRLFSHPKPSAQKEEVIDDQGETVSVTVDFKKYINPNSLEVSSAIGERSLADTVENKPYQFLRLGYYYLDKEKNDNKLTFNRTATLKDNWR